MCSSGHRWITAPNFEELIRSIQFLSTSFSMTRDPPLTLLAAGVVSRRSCESFPHVFDGDSTVELTIEKVERIPLRCSCRVFEKRQHLKQSRYIPRKIDNGS